MEIYLRSIQAEPHAEYNDVNVMKCMRRVLGVTYCPLIFDSLLWIVRVLIKAAPEQRQRLLLLFGGCLTSQQHAKVFQGRICSEDCAYCHTEKEV